MADSKNQSSPSEKSKMTALDALEAADEALFEEIGRPLKILLGGDVVFAPECFWYVKDGQLVLEQSPVQRNAGRVVRLTRGTSVTMCSVADQSYYVLATSRMKNAK